MKQGINNQSDILLNREGVKVRNVLVGLGIVLAALVIAIGIVQLKHEAEFEVIYLIIPPEAEVGENVIINATIKNIGESDGTYTAILFIDGTRVEAKDVTISAGFVQTISFSLIKKVEGAYTVRVGKLSRVLTIVAPTKITAEDCLIEPDNKVIFGVAIIQMEDSEIENLGCERGLITYYYGLIWITKMVEKASYHLPLCRR